MARSHMRMAAVALFCAALSVLSACSEKETKDTEVKMIGEPAQKNAELVTNMVNIFVNQCAGLRTNWQAVVSAEADLVEGQDVRRGNRYGWTKEVRLVLKTGEEGLPMRFDYARDQTLEFFMGIGRDAGVISTSVPGQKLCGFPYLSNLFVFQPLPALNRLDQH